MAAMLRRSSDAGRSRKVPSLPTGIRLFLAVVLLGNLSACDISRVVVPVSAITHHLSGNAFLRDLQETNNSQYQALMEGDNWNSPYYPENKVRVQPKTPEERLELYRKPVPEKGDCGLVKRHEEDFTLLTIPKISLKGGTSDQLKNPEGLARAIHFAKDGEGDYPIRVVPLEWLRESLETAAKRGRKCTVAKLIDEINRASQLGSLLQGVPEVLHPIVSHMSYLVTNAAGLKKTPKRKQEQFCVKEEEKFRKENKMETVHCTFFLGLWKYFDEAAGLICTSFQEFICTELKETLRQYIHFIVDQKKAKALRPFMLGVPHT